ncbi:MAG: hypothetical protein ACXWC6_03575 [Ramlibacter sp.]
MTNPSRRIRHIARRRVPRRRMPLTLAIGVMVGSLLAGAALLVSMAAR